MKNYKFKKNYHQFFYLLKSHFYEYKYYYLLCLLAVVFGAVLGILTILNTTVEIEVGSLVDALLLDFMKSDSSWISFLFYNIIDTLLSLFLIFICVYSVFLIPVALFILAYKSYYFFINITILIKCLNIFGIFNTIVIIIPSYILTLIIYSIFACVIMKIAYDFKRKRAICINDSLKANLVRVAIMVLAFKLIVIIYEIIMLSIFCNKFILS